MLWNRNGGRPGTEGVRWKCRRLAGRHGRKASGTVVLVHGLFLFGFYLELLARRLTRDGYDVYVCDYPTRSCGIMEHGESFAGLLDFIAEDSKAPKGSINIVTHSLGGIVARVALSMIEELPASRKHSFKCLDSSMIGRIVMLAPPNKGSDVARRVTRLLPWSKRFAKPLPELSSAPDSAIHSMPVPKSFQIGIIAGTYDIEVAVPYTILETASARKVLRSDHALMPFYPHVYRELSLFLKTGCFSS